MHYVVFIPILFSQLMAEVCKTAVHVGNIYHHDRDENSCSTDWSLPIRWHWLWRRFAQWPECPLYPSDNGYYSSYSTSVIFPHRFPVLCPFRSYSAAPRFHFHRQCLVHNIILCSSTRFGSLVSVTDADRSATSKIFLLAELLHFGDHFPARPSDFSSGVMVVSELQTHCFPWHSKTRFGSDHIKQFLFGYHFFRPAP